MMWNSEMIEKLQKEKQKLLLRFKTGKNKVIEYAKITDLTL